MERDELKDIWKEAAGENQTDLKAVYKSKSTSLVQKILDMIKLEQVLNKIFFPVGALACLLDEAYYHIIPVFIVIGIFAVWYYHRLIKRLEGIDINQPVHDYLRESLQAILLFRKHYLTTGLVLMTFGVYIGISLHRPDMNSFMEFWSKDMLIKLAIMTTIVVVTVFVVFHFIYGRNINKLKLLVQEFNQEVAY